MKEGDLLEVTWEDAAGDRNGWNSASEALAFSRRKFTVTTVGYVVRQTKRSLTLAQSQAQFDTGASFQLDHLMRIPTGIIRRTRRLK